MQVIFYRDLEIMPVGVTIAGTKLLLILVYRPQTSSKRVFLHQLLGEIERLLMSDYERLIVLGDFNLDNKSP